MPRKAPLNAMYFYYYLISSDKPKANPKRAKIRMVCILLCVTWWMNISINYPNKVPRSHSTSRRRLQPITHTDPDPLGLISPGVCVSVLSCRWPVGWLHHHTRVGPWTPLSRDHAPSFTSNPDMEPIKVQSEGGLNVTLTIRLLMHGKVPKNTTRLLFPVVCQRIMDHLKSPLWHKYT